MHIMRLSNNQPNGQPTTSEPTNKPPNQRVTVADAALLLGISEDAVRSRLRRGTLRRETGEDGTVFVVLGADQPTASQRLTSDRQTDQPTTDKEADEQAADSYKDELLEVLRDEVSHLRDQLDRARDSSAELRRIVAGLVQRVPELEPVREAAPAAPERPQTAADAEGDGPDHPDVTGPQKRFTWWRWLLGTE
jgi:hypothetical protein